MTSFITKVVGVTVGNRQDIIFDKCADGDLLKLEHEPNNPHDQNAVSVWKEDAYKGYFGKARKRQIGYINRDLATAVAEHLKSGGKAVAQILEITGGTPDKPALGVNITINLLD